MWPAPASGSQLSMTPHEQPPLLPASWCREVQRGPSPSSFVQGGGQGTRTSLLFGGAIRAEATTVSAESALKGRHWEGASPAVLASKFRPVSVSSKSGQPRIPPPPWESIAGLPPSGEPFDLGAPPQMEEAPPPIIPGAWPSQSPEPAPLTAQAAPTTVQAAAPAQGPAQVRLAAAAMPEAPNMHAAMQQPQHYGASHPWDNLDALSRSRMYGAPAAQSPYAAPPAQSPYAAPTAQAPYAAPAAQQPHAQSVASVQMHHPVHAPAPQRQMVPEQTYEVPVVTELFTCTGGCGRRWTNRDEVPFWSKSGRRKPWCSHCGADRAGWWNNYQPQWT